MGYLGRSSSLKFSLLAVSFLSFASHLTSQPILYFNLLFTYIILEPIALLGCHAQT